MGKQIQVKKGTTKREPATADAPTTNASLAAKWGLG